MHNRGKRNMEKGSKESGGRREAHGEEAATITFFVAEFGDKWGARDLYHKFKDLDDIDEVFVPNKKTRWGEEIRFC